MLGRAADGATSGAASVNDAGVAVGVSAPAYGDLTRAVRFDPDGTIHDLNALLDASCRGWALTSATAINTGGQIVGVGQFNGGPARAFLLTPVR